MQLQVRGLLCQEIPVTAKSNVPSPEILMKLPVLPYANKYYCFLILIFSIYRSSPLPSQMTNFLTRFHTYLRLAVLSQSFSWFYCVHYKHLTSLWSVKKECTYTASELVKTCMSTSIWSCETELIRQNRRSAQFGRKNLIKFLTKQKLQFKMWV